MQSRRLLKRAVPAAIVIVALAVFALHTHEFAAADDGCLCACGTCPQPEPAGLTQDRPHVGAFDTAVVDAPPRAFPVDAPIVRRGPPAPTA
jgi:hypothetical protein